MCQTPICIMSSSDLPLAAGHVSWQSSISYSLSQIYLTFWKYRKEELYCNFFLILEIAVILWEDSSVKFTLSHFLPYICGQFLSDYFLKCNNQKILLSRYLSQCWIEVKEILRFVKHFSQSDYLSVTSVTSRPLKISFITKSVTWNWRFYRYS